MKLRYIDKWEYARQFQQNYKYEEEQKICDIEITKLQRNINVELRYKVETKNIFNLQIEKYENQCDYWMNKYDNDYEQNEIDSVKINDEILKFNIENDTLYKLYEQRKLDINKHKNAKLARIIAEEYRITININIIKIQAWWRGIMVRQFLKRKKLQKSRRQETKKN